MNELLILSSRPLIQINPFYHIIPCGLEEVDKSVTSINQEISRAVSIEEVMELLKKNIGEEILDSVV